MTFKQNDDVIAYDDAVDEKPTLTQKEVEVTQKLTNVFSFRWYNYNRALYPSAGNVNSISASVNRELALSFVLIHVTVSTFLTAQLSGLFISDS